MMTIKDETDDFTFPPDSTAVGGTPNFDFPVVIQRMGWICPKCNKGVTPDLSICPCGTTVTWATSPGITTTIDPMTITCKTVPLHDT